MANQITQESSERGSLKSKSISSVMWRMVERCGNIVVQLIVQIVMARLLTPADFGALAIMLVFVNLGNVFVVSGLNTALIQAKRVDRASYSTVFWISVAISLFLYFCIFISASWIAKFYDMPRLTWPLRMLCLVLIVNAYNSVQVAKVTRDLEMRKTALATLVSVVVSGVLGVGSAYGGMGLWALVIQQLAYQVVNCIVLAFQVEWTPTFEFHPSEARELVRFGWKLLAAGLLNTGYQSLSDLIVGASFSVDSLGIFSQGKKYPEALAGAINGGIQPVALSAVSHVSSDVSAARSVARRALKSSCYVVMPMMALLASIAPVLVPTLMGAQWAASVPYMQIICITSAFLPVHSINLMALNAMGRSDLTLRLEVIKKGYGVLNLLICAYVLRDMWLLCCSYLLTSVLSQMVNAWPNKSVLKYGYLEQLHDMAPGLLLSIVSAVLAIAAGFVGLSSLCLIVLQVTVFAASYIGLSVMMHVEAFEYLYNTIRSFFVKDSSLPN